MTYNEIKYEVKPKDTLFSIAQKYKTTPKAIYELNKLNNTIIYPGQILLIPNNDLLLIYTNDDSFESILKKHHLKIEDLIEVNDILKYKLKDNQLIVVQNKIREYIVKENDNLETILNNLKISPKDLIDKNSSDWLSVGKTLKF